MRDFLPEQMVRRQYVIAVVQGVFEEFGFEPLYTPAVELEETLKGKYGQDAERLIYSASYGQGDERLSLRYDLSVPLCRVVALYPELPKPFKRYQIAPVWRADRPQKGRFREFYQCDVDTVGSASMLADAETVAVIYNILYRLGFRDFTVCINNRKILNGIGKYAGIPESLLRGLYQSIDKLSRIGIEGVRQELLTVGLPDAVFEWLRRVVRLCLQGKLKLEDVAESLREEALTGENSQIGGAFTKQVAAVVGPLLKDILSGVEPGSVAAGRVQEEAGRLVGGTLPALREVYASTTSLITEEAVDRLLSLLEIKGDNRSVLGRLREKLSAYPDASEGITELEEILRYLDLLGVPERYCTLDVSMARGLEYYTGPIYETIVREAGIGSVTGGGRYDDLIGMFSERSLPATGTTIGIERIIVVMEEQGMFPASIGRTATQVLVTTFNASMLDGSLKLAAELRQAGLRVQVYENPDPLREQIGYANEKGVPVVAILGPDEAGKGQVTVRNLRIEQQETLSREQVVPRIQAWLDEGVGPVRTP